MRAPFSGTHLSPLIVGPHLHYSFEHPFRSSIVDSSPSSPALSVGNGFQRVAQLGMLSTTERHP